MHYKAYALCIILSTKFHQLLASLVVHEQHQDVLHVYIRRFILVGTAEANILSHATVNGYYHSY